MRANTRLECTSATTILWKCPKRHGTTVASIIKDIYSFLSKIKNRRGGGLYRRPHEECTPADEEVGCMKFNNMAN